VHPCGSLPCLIAGTSPAGRLQHADETRIQVGGRAPSVNVDVCPERATVLIELNTGKAVRDEHGSGRGVQEVD